ncbi:hypothetical protein [Blastococcus sp. CT_GayMR16]|uniref:hypothetical protein n=1 Tax=Blastococcus sp. CT_GayMR16 TaxID=2559607 RepID=UPI0010747C40|nr:hypothetical protein [Blastococcus sp. CT_GayMR16]TFV88318.1 hypothetical protein E4P38_11260 [Blastococcus sp. CT_GayMR16]
MSTEMPDQIPLDMPPGDPDALADLVRAIAGAGVCVAAVDDRLLGAADAAPGWLGDDAAAAAAQVVAVTALVREVSAAVLPASGRLRTHEERLRETRRQVAALGAEQSEQFAEAWRRLGQVEDLRLQVMSGGADVRAIVADVEAGEGRRRRRHTALLEELEDDAAATARVLDDAWAAVGGRRAPGDANRVVAYLAAQLPGWGDLELARRGRALADGFGQFINPEDREDLARDALAFAGSVSFAGALLAGLGPVGTRDALEHLGGGDYGPQSALARVVALALGAAARNDGTGPVAEVLAAEYTSADDPAGLDDLGVLGMGTVLAASLALGPRGLDPQTVAAWGRQIALRERVLGAASVDRINPLSDVAAPVDALVAVVAILGEGTDPAAGAAFLNRPWVWGVLLARTWEDCGTSLQALVASAGAVEGPAGEAVVRGGLEALGAPGGREGGRLAGRPGCGERGVDRAGRRTAVHVSLAGEVLMSGVDGSLPAADAALLRGLGYVTLDRSASAVVEEALQGWVTAQPVDISGGSSLPQLPAVVVPNAYLAVQNYGQELAYTLHGLEEQREAQDRAFLWTMTVDLAVSLAPGSAGVVLGLLADYAAMGLGYDGTWDNGGFHGLTFEPTAEIAALTPDEGLAVLGIAEQARDSFERTAGVLGHPAPPTSPQSHWYDPILDAVAPGPADRIEQMEERRGGRVRLPR